MREGGRVKGRWTCTLSGKREGEGRWSYRLRKGEGNNDGSEILEV